MNTRNIQIQIAPLRKKKGVTQEDLVKALGVSFQAVSKWETGTTYPMQRSIDPDAHCAATHSII